jgi:hypothetical protein
VVLVLLVVLVAGLMSANRVLSWGAQRLGEKVLRAMPEDVSPVDRERLRLSLECAAQAAREKRASERDLGTLLRICREALVDGSVSRAEAEGILQAADRCCPPQHEEVLP